VASGSISGAHEERAKQALARIAEVVALIVETSAQDAGKNQGRAARIVPIGPRGMDERFRCGKLRLVAGDEQHLRDVGERIAVAFVEGKTARHLQQIADGDGLA
jgi:hypothetical protein